MKERSYVVNTMDTDNGDFLDCGRNHSIIRTPDGRITARFKNPHTENGAVRLTLTALTPHTTFVVTQSGESLGTRRANRAGIMECAIPMPPGADLFFEEQRTAD